MRFIRLPVMVVVLFCSGVAAAQQNDFVLLDDEDDPCRRFKLRVLIPAADESNFKLRVRTPSPDIDPTMVRNPCPRNEAQIARQTAPHIPNYGWELLPPPFGVQPVPPPRRAPENKSKSVGPGLPPAVEMMRRRGKP